MEKFAKFIALSGALLTVFALTLKYGKDELIYGDGK